MAALKRGHSLTVSAANSRQQPEAELGKNMTHNALGQLSCVQVRFDSCTGRRVSCLNRTAFVAHHPKSTDVFATPPTKHLSANQRARHVRSLTDTGLVEFLNRVKVLWALTRTHGAINTTAALRTRSNLKQHRTDHQDTVVPTWGDSEPTQRHPGSAGTSVRATGIT